MAIGLFIAFALGAAFGYIMCAVLSANTTDEEWQKIAGVPAIKRPVTDKITPEKIEQIKALAKEGKTVKEIAVEVGVSEPTVRKYKVEAAL